MEGMITNAKTLGPRAMTIKDFDILDTLRKSESGAVYKAKHIPTGTVVVLKERSKPELASTKNIMHELELLSKCSHPNVIKCHGAFWKSKNRSYYMVLEFAKKGDLSKMIERRKKRCKRFEEEEVWKIFVQICKGLQHIHDQGIVHRDLKTLNVFIDADDTVKIGDLGVSKETSQQGDLMSTFCGTPLYLSPELCRNQHYTEKTDVWSLGVILYELAMLKPPFTGRDFSSLATEIKKGDFKPLSSCYSQRMNRSLRSFLQRDYSRRPTVSQFLAWLERDIARSRAQGLQYQEAPAAQVPDGLRHADGGSGVSADRENVDGNAQKPPVAKDRDSKNANIMAALRLGVVAPRSEMSKSAVKPTEARITDAKKMVEDMEDPYSAPPPSYEKKPAQLLGGFMSPTKSHGHSTPSKASPKPGTKTADVPERKVAPGGGDRTKGTCLSGRRPVGGVGIPARPTTADLRANDVDDDPYSHLVVKDSTDTRAPKKSEIAARDGQGAIRHEKVPECAEGSKPTVSSGSVRPASSRPVTRNRPSSAGPSRGPASAVARADPEEKERVVYKPPPQVENERPRVRPQSAYVRRPADIKSVDKADLLAGAPRASQAIDSSTPTRSNVTVYKGAIKHLLGDDNVRRDPFENGRCRDGDRNSREKERSTHKDRRPQSAGPQRPSSAGSVRSSGAPPGSPSIASRPSNFMEPVKVTARVVGEPDMSPAQQAIRAAQNRALVRNVPTSTKSSSQAPVLANRPRDRRLKSARSRSDMAEKHLSDGPSTAHRSRHQQSVIERNGRGFYGVLTWS